MNTTLRVTFALTLGLLAVMGTLALIGLPTAQASPNGSIRYVATSGNDLSNDCTNVSTPCRTVQHAVDMASSGGEIRVATGVYTDASVRPRKDIVATGVVTQIVYISKTVTIRGGFATADWTAPHPLTQPTTLDAQGRGRALYLTGYHTATIEGLRLTGGNATGLGGDAVADAGGGVYLWAAKATISNCQVFSSTAGRGGGFYLSSSPSTLSANTISTNTAPIDGGGGGLFLYQSVATLNKNTIVSNTAAYNGGGVYLSVSNATLNGNTIVRNTVKTFGGGGLYVFSSRAAVINNLIAGNAANQYGGGITLQTSSGTLSSNTVISNSVNGRGGGVHLWADSTADVSGNTVMFNTAADSAGGVYVDNSPARFIENRVISNTARDYGGGFYLNGNSPTLIANTISGNTAGGGGGLHLEECAGTLNRNIIMANRADYGGGFYIYASTARLFGNTIISNVAQFQGGGLCMNLTNDTLINNVVADNWARNEAAGLLVMQAAPRLLHNTIARNTGGDGSGIYVTNVGSARSAVALTNTILVSQTVGITVTSGNTATLNGVLWYSNVINYDGGGVFMVTEAVTGDPAFAADGYHLTAASSAIDAGVNAGVATDIDGNPRSTAPDLGADEYFDACHARLNDEPTDYSTVQAAVDASTHPTDVVKVAGYCADMQPRAGLMQVVYLTKTLTLRGGYTVTNWTTPDPIANPTMLDASRQGRVFYVGGNVSPVIEGLSITGGDATGLDGEGAGGGIYIVSATVTISQTWIFSNTAAMGGGVFLREVSSGSTLRSNSIMSNTAASNGGGVGLRHGRAIVQGNAIMGNTAQGDGGGVFLDMSGATLVANTISRNVASDYGGGGLSVLDSAASIRDNLISYNSTGGHGGGIDVQYKSDATLERNVISHNAAQYGGGVYIQSHTPVTLSNTVIADNSVTQFGSGLYSSDSYPRLLHTTIARNSGGDGVGVYLAGLPVNRGTLAMTNTILVSQTVGITVTQGNTATLNGVLWYGNVINYGGPGAIAVTNDITGDPAFAADGYRLTVSSKAIDAGVDAGVTDDIDGDSRPFADGPDLGADEYLCYVRLNDSPTLYPSVQAALDVSTLPTDIVKVAGTCRGAPQGGYSVAYITKTLTLRGGYSADFSTWNPQRYPAILDALAQGPVILIGEDISPTVETLRLTNGSTGGYGGGISAYRASPTISGCLIYSNTAHYCGGGISLEHGSNARLLNNQIYSNTAANAGGIYLDRSTNATLIGNQIFGNLATPYSGYGGGLALMHSPGALLTDNWVYRNTASKGVGGIWLNYITNTTLINTVIADNRASTRSSGLYIEGSVLRLLHTTIARNTGGDGSGIYITNDGPASNVELTNTILVNHSVGVTVTQGNTATLNGVLWYSNTINYGGAGVVTATNAVMGNPAFAADGYHLTAGSTAINAGVASGVMTDIDGDPRLGAPDLGADERVLRVFLPLVLKR